jgi:hypothetical protein
MMPHSRYLIDQGYYRVAVGWDQARASYWLECYSLPALAELDRLEQMWMDMAVEMRGHDSLIDQIAAAEADCGPICYRGTTQGEIPSTARLYCLALPYADIPMEVLRLLIADRLKDPPAPTMLDLFIQRITASAARRASRS